MNKVLHRGQKSFSVTPPADYFSHFLDTFNKTVDFSSISVILFVKNQTERGMTLYKLCKTEQSAERQHELESGLLAIMSTKRYEEISVSDLCDHLGIPRKAFYRYFSSKDGALQALIDHTLLDFESFYAEPSSKEKRTAQTELERFFRFWHHHKTLLDALNRSDLSGILIERAISYAVSGTLLPRRFLPNDDSEVQQQVTVFAVCGLMCMILDWHRSGYAHSVAHMAKLAVRMVSQPLFHNVNGVL